MKIFFLKGQDTLVFLRIRKRLLFKSYQGLFSKDPGINQVFKEIWF